MTPQTSQTALLPGLKSLGRRHELIWLLTVDALRKQFAGSVLGLWWVLAKPFLLVGLYAFLFLGIFKPAVSPGLDGPEYLLLLLTGMGPWLLLAEPLTAASGAIAANTPLVTRVVFPTEVLPVCRVLGAAVSGCATLLFLGVLLAYQGRLGLWAAAVPAAVFVQLLFVMGLAWVLATVCVSLPDFAQALPFSLNVWLFLSPVVYTPDMLPAGWRWITALNPMSHVIAIYRALLLGNTAPDLTQVLTVSIVAIMSFLGGYVIFMKRRAILADLV